MLSSLAAESEYLGCVTASASLRKKSKKRNFNFNFKIEILTVPARSKTDNFRYTYKSNFPNFRKVKMFSVFFQKYCNHSLSFE